MYCLECDLNIYALTHLRRVIVLKTSTYSLIQRRKASSKFPSNSEAFALDALENLERMLSQYYMHSNLCTRFRFSTIFHCVHELN